MKTTIIICAIMAISYALSAQEDIVKIIREDYINYNKKIQDAELGESSNFTSPIKIKTVQIRPALGPVDIEITYYFDEENKNAGNEEIDKQITTASLRKIVYKESMPSFTDYREVFFDKAGNIKFYYSKLTGYTCGEKRFYFNQSKLIKIKFNPLEGDECIGGTAEDKFPDITRYTGKLVKDDLDWEKWILKYSSSHKKAFQNLFESFN